MRNIRHAAFFATMFLLSVVAADAHPGHGHADFFSVLRQPLADWRHVLITAMTALTAGIACHLVTRSLRAPALVRWTSAVGAAIGTAWLLS